MKGTIFSQLEAFVEKHHGLALWAEALDNCSLPSKGIYISTKTYPDEELFKLVGFLTVRLEVSAPALIRGFGQFLFAKLMPMAPLQARLSKSLKEFLLMVDEIIHVEVLKLHPDATLPEIKYQQGAESLVLLYKSPRKLCYLSEGLILAAADHFKESVIVEQDKCMHEGCTHCEIVVRFQ